MTDHDLTGQIVWEAADYLAKYTQIITLLMSKLKDIL